jgi:transglutaminase-like putative cysteine protease
MSKQFYEKWFFNNWIPDLKVEYNLLIDKNIKFDYKTDRRDIKPEITNKDDFMLYAWKTNSEKPIRPESYMPALIDVCGVFSVSTVPDWNYISKWYYDISNTKTETDRELIETVNSLLKGKGNITQLQKAQIFYNFIEQNIHYSYVPFRQNGTIPQKASDVLITRIGDCKDLTVLFTSMCKVAGIKAEIVLVETRKNGVNWMNLPSFNFDHAISKVFPDGKEYYIELTSNYLPFAALGDQDLKAVVLDVDNDPAHNVTPKILSPETRKPNNLYRELRVSFKDDSLINSLSCKRTGSLAAGMRYNYRDLGKDEREKKFTKTISRVYSNTKLLSLNFDSTLNYCSDTLTYNYSSAAPGVFSYINGLAIVKLPLSDKLDPMDFLSIEDRKFPVEAWEYTPGDTLTERIIITFPANKKLAEVPKSVHYSCNQADYVLTFKVHGKELLVNRTMIYKLDEVPVSDYQIYRKFIESVVNADSQQIGFN